MSETHTVQSTLRDEEQWQTKYFMGIWPLHLRVDIDLLSDKPVVRKINENLRTKDLKLAILGAALKSL